jgi:hypothetical protein
VLYSTPESWFGRPVHAIQDADLLRWRLVTKVAARLLAPRKEPPK